MKTALAAAAAAAALLTAGCSSAGHPAWCHAAEHLKITATEPARLRHDIRLMRAGLAASAEPAAAGLKTAERAVKAGKDGGAILRADCGYHA